MTTDTNIHPDTHRSEAPTVVQPTWAHVGQAAPSPRKKARGPSTARIVSGAIAGVVAAVFALGGGAVLAANGEKNADGFYMSSAHVYTGAPGTAAIRTDDLDLNLDGLGWLVDDKDLGKVRLDVKSDKPVFAGIAKTSDVDRYLKGVATTTLTDVDFDPFGPTYESTKGRHEAKADPAEQGFWAATADSSGRLDWPVEDGNWTVVVMNEDGSPDVQAQVKAGANVPVLGDIGWTLLGIGTVGLLGAAALIITGAKRR